MSDSTVRGRFVWHELLTTDTKSAGVFFSKAIGWKTQPWGEDASYTLFLAGGRQMAGLMTLPEEARKMGSPNHWLCYIGTPNVDETAKQAASLGATVLNGPEDIPTIGRFAVLQDPQGAVFAIFTPKQTPAETPADVGDFSWHELATTDWRGALTFYQKLFGWSETSAMDMGEMGTYQMYGRNGQPMGGIFNKSPQMPGPAMWIAYIKVPDSKKTAATVKQLGGQIINGPMEVPGGDWIAQGLDLQGAMFAVHSAKPVAAVPAAKGAPVRKAGAKKAVARRALAKKAVAKKTTARKATAKKAAPKAAAKGKKKKAAPARKSASSKKRAPARKARGKKARASKGRKGAKRR